MPYNTDVTVSGMGQLFDDVLVAIIDGLTAAGAIITVENEYPVKDEDVEMLREHIKGKRVTLRVDHLPWGG